LDERPAEASMLPDPTQSLITTPDLASLTIDNYVNKPTADVIHTVEDLMNSLMQQASIKIADDTSGLVDAFGNPIGSGQPAAVVAPVEFDIKNAQPRAVAPGSEEVPVEAPPDAAKLMNELRSGQMMLEQIASKTHRLKLNLQEQTKPFFEEQGNIKTKQQAFSNQLAEILNKVGLRLVTTGDQIGYLTTIVQQGAKLTDAQKVAAILKSLPEAAQVIEEAQKRADELVILRRTVPRQQYQQWNQRKTSADEDQYADSLYQEMYNSLSDLVSQLDSLNLELAA
jgi:hypothetical protein